MSEPLYPFLNSKKIPFLLTECITDLSVWSSCASWLGRIGSARDMTETGHISSLYGIVSSWVVLGVYKHTVSTLFNTCQWQQRPSVACYLFRMGSLTADHMSAKLSQVSGGVPLNIVFVIEGNGVKVPAWLFPSCDADTHGQREAVRIWASCWHWFLHSPLQKMFLE